MAVAEVCRRHGMSSTTLCSWKDKLGGLEVSDAKRRKALEEENAKLRRLVAEAMLDNAGLKDLLSRKWWRPPPSGAAGVPRDGHRSFERAPPGEVRLEFP